MKSLDFGMWISDIRQLPNDVIMHLSAPDDCDWIESVRRQFYLFSSAIWHGKHRNRVGNFLFPTLLSSVVKVHQHVIFFSETPEQQGLLSLSPRLTPFNFVCVSVFL